VWDPALICHGKPAQPAAHHLSSLAWDSAMAVAGCRWMCVCGASGRPVVMVGSLLALMLASD
jgi:hypothetical protein